ncbi:MAG: hypothetical protein ACXADO_09855 [Candidatus Thorarchaeota archaeon]|jgi:hypothetical protein
MSSYEAMSKEERLKRASSHIFSMGLQDAADSLCRANMKYGLAKLHHLQHTLGLNPSATFVGAPDSTITRNVRRWENGFGYGGKLSWGDGAEKLIILDSMPNACGMLVGGLEESPTMDQLLDHINSVLTSDEVIDDIQIDWDFAAGNHFIDIYEVRPVSEEFTLESRFVFVIHGSVPELKGDNESKFGFGLYVHKSRLLREMAEEISTPHGPLHILTEGNASKYMELNDFACELSKKKRRRAAELLFEDFTEVSNPIHQGLLNMNAHILGCQDTEDPDNMILPITLRSDLPAYLAKGNENLDEEAIEQLGFTKRSEKHDVKDRLLNANILPHGGGYKYPGMLGINRVMETKSGTRYYVTEHATGQESEKVFSSPRELEFTYRGQEVLWKAVELRLCSVAARLMPRVILKI